MKFESPFRLGERLNNFMQMKRMLIVSLFCLTVSSCGNRQVRATPTSRFVDIPTSVTPMLTITAMPVVYPNKFSVIDDRRIKFDNWQVSFLLPKNWDINKHQLGFQAHPYVELYFFYGLEYPNDHGGKSMPELSFDFRPLPDNTDINELLKNIKNWTDDDQFKVEKYYSPKEMGDNFDQSVGYKCSFAYGFKKECYVLRIVYQKEIIEVHLVADKNVVETFESQFLEIIRNISIEK